MSFKAIKRLQHGWEEVLLKDENTGTQVVIVPRAGAILNGFTVETPVGQVDIIEGYAGHADFTENVHMGFKSAKLSPFVCRLHKGNYAWKGKSYHVDKFFIDGSALHGLLYDAAFDLMDFGFNDHGAWASLRYAYNGNHPGYPFPFNCTVIYRLGPENTLTIHSHISNTAAAKTEIPMADGWHPYFTLGGKADDWWLEVASDSMLEYDAGLIPTGKYVHDESFFPGRQIGNRKLDNGFLLKEDISPLCVLKNPANGLSVEFISAKHYPYLQLYIPDNRRSIAIENLSSAPDAFNNGMGLLILKPGDKADFETTIRVKIQNPQSLPAGRQA